MGAQQIKSDDHLILEGKLEKRTENVTWLPAEQKLMNEIPVRTVMHKQKLYPSSITLADFAKIKVEPQSAEECLNDHTELVVDNNSQVEPLHQRVKCEHTDVFGLTDESLESEIKISVSSAEVFCVELNPVPNADPFLNLSNIEVKKELLDSHGVERSLTTVEDHVSYRNNTIVTLSDETNGERTNELRSALKTEIIEDSHFTESLESENIVQSHTDKTKLHWTSGKPEKSADKEHSSNNGKLVKNPFAFLKKNQSCSVKEHEVIGNTNQINLNELIIKSEYNDTSEVNQQIYNNANSNNTSLDVNASDVNTDFDEGLSNKSIEDATSHISINSTSTSLKYFSTIEVSSVENEDYLPVQKSQLPAYIKISKTPKPYKSNITRFHKLRGRRKLNDPSQGKRQKQNKCASKTVGRKRIIKTNKSKKYAEKDTVFKSGFSKGRILKNLPKTGIKTRKKANKADDKKKNTIAKEDFPKPFKLEQTLHKDHSLALELPKPIMFKCELNANIINKKIYLKPEFQPYVRLKRLERDELLVPLITKNVRKIRNFKSTTNAVKRLNYHQMERDNMRDLHMHQAFSLNPCIKFNRFSIDREYSYCNDQPSFYSRHATPNSMANDTPNVSLAPTETKYFTAQEIYSLFHSTTPDGSSMFNSHVDSGVSTSTPSMPAILNNTVLLEIAAERAFINNHLMHFGYSPIQFDMYNNLNDLIVFLKYLFGNVNKN